MSETLIDFLLARIAEDEAPTYELVPYGCGAWCCAPPGWVGHRCLICDTPAEFGGTVEAIEEICREHEEKVHRRSRTLAECEVKRDIMREHVGYGGICGTCGVRKPETGERWPCRTLRLLSWPYVDHPDYRDEWRP